VIEGRADETLRLRRALGAPVQIWADVHVKHGRSLAHASAAREAEDAVHRGLADAVIVSGAGTGRATDPVDVRAVTELRLGVPVLVGSGLTLENCAASLASADGGIVGTALKRGGVTTAALDGERLRRFVETVRAAAHSPTHPAG
jgi:membrane complex biogenesis BtpA family protein